MHQTLKHRGRIGFTAIELLLMIAVVAIVGGLVYVYILRSNNSSNSATPTASTSQGVSAPAGTTSSITQITEQDAQTEIGVDKSADSQTQQNADSANSAANDVGGAYNASNF
jgi:FlaG/FlaF family flagellin (archaellin)